MLKLFKIKKKIIIIIKTNYKFYNITIKINTVNFFFKFIFKNNIFIKKNNIFIKKINYISNNNTIFTTVNNIFTNYFLQNSFFFLFFQNNFITSSLKLLDLRKKFSKSLFEYKLLNQNLLSLKLKKKKKNYLDFKFFNFFFRKINSYNTYMFFFNFFFLLKLIINYKDLFYLINNNFIFLNRKKLKSSKTSFIFLKKNDFIELIFFKHYFFYINYFFNSIKYLNKKSYTLNFKNKKSFYSSQILFFYLNNYFIFSNKINYIQSDLKTLTFIIILNLNSFKSNLLNKNNFNNFYINEILSLKY